MTRRPQYLDLPALAVSLGCSTRSVLRMVKRGELPHPEKFGRLARWNTVTLDRCFNHRGLAATLNRPTAPSVDLPESLRRDGVTSRLSDGGEKGGA